MTPIKYKFPFPPPFRYSAQVVIYEHDGTIAIEHGGVEMGQGINTKVREGDLRAGENSKVARECPP